MPRKVTAYACKWNCRRRVTTHKKDMERHESRCKLNPASKACATCEFEEGADIGEVGWFCTEDHLPEAVGMIYDCPHHVLRKEDNA